VGEVSDHEAHLTMEDLQLALKKTKNIKFPSIDSLNIELFRCTSTSLNDILLRSVSNVWSEHQTSKD
jgi:hypothetical protein